MRLDYYCPCGHRHEVHALTNISGIGVVDTTSLWAASVLLGSGRDEGPEDIFNHPNRELYATKSQYFASMLHSLVLYDELRTDYDVLNLQPNWYATDVQAILERLSPVVKVTSIPNTVFDADIVTSILPAFIEKTRDAIVQHKLSPALRQMESAARLKPVQDTPSYSYGVANILAGKEAQDLREFAGSEVIKGLLGGNIEANYYGLARNIGIVARSMRYCAHAIYLQSSEGTASAFCASPRRIELLSDYMEPKHFAELQYGAKSFLDLLSKLGLPSNGYNFSVFSQSFNPISISDFWSTIGHLPPLEALERVIELRQTDAARELREFWAERLWSRGSHVVEGFAQSVRNSTIHGDLIQVIATPAGPGIVDEQMPLVERMKQGLLGRLRNSRQVEQLKLEIIRKLRSL
jgi:hypothetical protein